LILEIGIKKIGAKILIMIKSRPHKKIRHQDSDLLVLILEFGISSDG
jgi:hypothetical protein